VSDAATPIKKLIDPEDAGASTKRVGSVDRRKQTISYKERRFA
jgi:hypothetical protein